MRKKLAVILSALSWAAKIVELQHQGQKVLYLSGPMRGIKDFNFPAFHAAAAYLRECGHIVVSPAEMGDAPGWVWHDYMIRDLVVAALTDGIVLLEGWQASKGAKAELAVMEATGGSVWHLLTHKDGGYVIATTAPEPELGRLDVSFTLVTKSPEGIVVDQPAVALEFAENARRILGAGAASRAIAYYDQTQVAIEDFVVHSSEVTAGQGFTEGVQGLDYAEVANG